MNKSRRAAGIRVFTFLIPAFLFLSHFTVERAAAQKEFPAAANSSFVTLPFKKCWAIQDSRLIADKLASDNISNLYLSFPDGKLSAVNIDDGGKVWEADLGGEIISVPITDSENKNVYVMTISTNSANPVNPIEQNQPVDQPHHLKLWSISRTTGLINWQKSLDDTLGADDIHGSENPVQKIYLFKYRQTIIISRQNGSLISVSNADGTVKWERSLAAKLSATPYDLSDRLVFSTLTNELAIVSMEDGKIIRRTKIPFSAAVIFARDEKSILTGTKKGEIIAVSATDGKVIWKVRSGAEISNLAETESGLLAASFDNFIYFIAPENGRLLWKKRLEGRISAAPLVIGNFAVINTVANFQATVLDLADGKAVNQISLSDGDYFAERPLRIRHLIMFPTLRGLDAFTTSDQKCPTE